MLRELKTRLRKLKEKASKAAKKSGGQKGIRKEGFMFVMAGKTNSGKSCLLGKLTNARPLVGAYEFTTRSPEIGTFSFEGVSAQVVDVPSIGSESFDVGLVNNADCLLIVVEKLEEIEEIEGKIMRAKGKRIVVVNKVDKLNNEEKKKLGARLKSERIDGIIVSCVSGDGLDELRGKMFSKMGVIRIYMKEPGRGKQEKPMVLPSGSAVRDVGERIYKGFSKTVKEIRLTGPSSKFPNQRVGLSHVLKDNDVVEFHTR